jgi:hypothetical protein
MSLVTSAVEENIEVERGALEQRVAKDELHSSKHSS